MRFLVAMALVFSCVDVLAAEAKGVEKIFLVILENTNYWRARSQPFLSQLAEKGADLKDIHGVARPSQPNYIALTSGGIFNVTTNKNVNLEVTNIVDLLEAKNKTWRVYADDFPGHCFLGAKSGSYTRKHVPFLSYTNIQKDAKRCANIVEGQQYQTDYSKNSLADFSFYVPNNTNNGHDTSAAAADLWLSKTFSKMLNDKELMKKLLFIVTYDESHPLDFQNHILTIFYGAGVKPNSVSNKYYTLYSLLRTIEDLFGLGTLSRQDATSAPIDDIWL